MENLLVDWLRRPPSVTSACAPVMALLAQYVFDNAVWSAWGTILSRRSQHRVGAVLVPKQRTDGVAKRLIGVILFFYPICLLLSIF
jgi:hypothetical protein